MNKIQNLFQSKLGRILVRLAYLLPGGIFAYLLIDYQDNWSSKSSFGLSFFNLFIIAAGIFLYQGLRNSILGWIGVVMLYLIYGYGLIEAYHNWRFLMVVKSDPDDIGYWVALFVIYLLVGVFLFIIKPRKRYV